MDELEFCLKSLSYPIGMLLEGKERKRGSTVRITRNTVTIPEIPFGAACYLVGVALFDSLDMVDKKRLGGDYEALEGFRRKLLDSVLGEKLRPYLESPGRYVSPGERLSFEWLEFMERKEKVAPYLNKVREALRESKNREEFLERTGFLSELGVDEGLLLAYLADESEKEAVNAALGKHNPKFKKAVVRYFKALRG